MLPIWLFRGKLSRRKFKGGESNSFRRQSYLFQSIFLRGQFRRAVRVKDKRNPLNNEQMRELKAAIADNCFENLAKQKGWKLEENMNREVKLCIYLFSSVDLYPQNLKYSLQRTYTEQKLFDGLLLKSQQNIKTIPEAGDKGIRKPGPNGAGV